MRLGRVWWAVMALVCVGARTALAAEAYVIDAANSYVGFTVEHLSINPVHGQFTAVDGRIVYDEQAMDRSGVDVTIQAASVTMAHAERDQHLRGPEFLDAERFPEITFRSHRVEPYGKRGRYICFGTLTLHGVSHEVGIPFHLAGRVHDQPDRQRLAFEGTLSIDRRDYDITWSGAIDGGWLIAGNTVDIVLHVEAIQDARDPCLDEITACP